MNYMRLRFHSLSACSSPLRSLSFRHVLLEKQAPSLCFLFALHIAAVLARVVITVGKRDGPSTAEVYLTISHFFLRGSSCCFVSVHHDGIKLAFWACEVVTSKEHSVGAIASNLRRGPIDLSFVRAGRALWLSLSATREWEIGILHGTRICKRA